MTTSEGLTAGLHIMNSQEFSDEDIDSDLASIPSSPKKSTLCDKPSREAVSRTTSALTAGLSVFHSSPSSKATELPDEFREQKDKLDEDNGDDCNNPDRSDDDNIDPEKLANITAAATKRNLTHAAARHVDPDTAQGTFGEMPSHPEMLGRILKTLRPSTSDRLHVVPSLPVLERKVAQLHTNKNKKLSVPVPEVVTARLERSEAYEKANIEITEKWQDTILHNRRSEQLSFPLDDPQLINSTTDLSSRPPSRRRGASEHELEIEKILKEAGVDSNRHAEQSENAAINDAILQGKISEEDVLRRRRELARMRSLAFHFDQKMKRIKKIKSKKYRRLMKKERERLAAEGDAVGDAEAEEEEAIAAERRRVEERVTLRHKNTSKWIRRQLQRGEAKKDTETRAAIEGQLRVHEELKQRQRREVGNGKSDDDDGSGDSDGDEASDGRQLELLRSELEDEGSENNGASEGNGVMGLRFMQAAKERKRQQALAMLDKAQEELDMSPDKETGDPGVGPGASQARKDEDENVSDGERDNGGLEESMKEQEIDLLARRIRDEYDDAAANGIIRDRTDGSVDVDTAASIIRSANKTANTFTTRLDGRLTTDENNPWLKGVVFEVGQSADTAKVDNNPIVETSRQKNKRKRKNPSSLGSNQHINTTNAIVQNSEHSVATNGAANVTFSLNPDTKGSEAKKEKKVSNNFVVKHGSKRRKKRAGKTKEENVATPPLEKRQAAGVQRGTDEPRNNQGSPPDYPEGSPILSCGKNGKRFDRTDADDLKKMESIAQAFAGAGGADLDEFEAAKQTDIQESLPTAKSLHAEMLPGWGQWHGAGMTEIAKKRAGETPFARAARERLAAARKNVVQSRSDRNMRNVILEQKRYETATKLTIGFVPFPFKSREQWECELSRPLCREFASNKAFRAGVERRVETKLGKVINPIENPIPKPENPGQDALVNRGHGKKAVIDLRKRKATYRVNARRDFLT